MSIQQQREFEIPFDVKLLPYASTAPIFADSRLFLDPMRDTATSIKERLGVRGLVICNAAIVGDGEVVKNWFTAGTTIVVAQCSAEFEEADEWMSNPNQMARLLHAGLRPECALVCLSRAFWQEGFPQFSEAATFLRNVVDSTGTHDYQRRVDVVCLTHPRKELNHVAPFNEKSGQIMFPPTLRGEVRGSAIVDEWVDQPRESMSVEELDKVRAAAARMKAQAPYLVAASRAVVRIFGYHPLNHDVSLSTSSMLSSSTLLQQQQQQQQRVVPFTGFFVSPRHILSTRTAIYSAQHDTYAQRFAFTRDVRAVHGMLRPDLDLFECREVPGVVDFIADSIRNIGVVLDGSKVVPGRQAAPWSDLLLLEVVDRRHYSSDAEYLLPELDPEVRKGDELFALHFAAKPSEAYIADMFGFRGHNRGGALTEDHLRRQFWQYDCKACSIGNAVDDSDTLRRVRHNCTLLEGTRGAPILRNTHVDFDNDAAKLKRMGEPTDGNDFACTYAAISTGRAIDLFEKERENIIGMSTSELARVESLAVNMTNEAVTTGHVCLILLYIRYIRDEITNADHRLHLHKFLHPYSVLVSRDLLSQCHRKMLKDADDCNEYGMDFYEHQDLDAALAAFREGARMFSTASIPNLSEYEIELKNALQTNVSSVVVAKLK